MRRTPWRPAATLGALLLLNGAALAQEAPSRAATPTFAVTIRPGLADEEGASGRLLVVLGKPGGGAPRLAIGHTGMDAAPVLGRDVDGLKPGVAAVLDDKSPIFPIASLASLRPGRYAVQAVLHTNRDLNLVNAPGDLYSEAKVVEIDRASGPPPRIGLELSRAVPAEAMPRDEGLIRYLKIESKLLRAFHGRPIFLRAGVILPRDFDREPGRRYPLRVHVGGYGARFTGVSGRMAPGAAFRSAWMADDAPRMILVHLDGAGPYGDPYQVNSANHGPYGDAVTRELIPEVERRFRGIGKGTARAVDGGSTGGWVSLALQVFYPDSFAGAWSSCADGVDFRSFQLVNIYEDANAYVNRHGFERPGSRDTTGEVRTTMRHECQVENVLGLGDSWAMSGGQWAAWNATYGPRGPDGRPVPLWDPRTGRIDRSAVDHWKAYDLRLVLETNWPKLAPRLRGKLHIWMGDADDYFLNNAMHQLDAFLSRAEPPYEGSITFAPGKGHCWQGLSEAEILRQMDAAFRKAGGFE
ncbi:Putative esterase [Aquisphaera giovannonii]|uniref:Esterase n=1 Tax=Aquisphaera giovannonii TaxID=406548 RepID=A0A5B9VWU7_9BACT|nr:alpha/beta hydrolase-fold protein [Aquisphaera giovannonii]QEH32180.1 Putative esterase [Aquisphaera giovannonii]